MKLFLNKGSPSAVYADNNNYIVNQLIALCKVVQECHDSGLEITEDFMPVLPTTSATFENFSLDQRESEMMVQRYTTICSILGNLAGLNDQTAAFLSGSLGNNSIKHGATANFSSVMSVRHNQYRRNSIE